MTTQELIHYIQHPEYLQAEHLASIQELCQQYPYCAPFAILLAKTLDNMKDIQARQQLRKAAMYAYHREELQRIIQLPAQVEEKKENGVELQPTGKEDSVPNITKKIGSHASPNSTSPKETTEQLLETIGYEFSDTNLQSHKELKGHDLIDKFIAESPRISTTRSYFDEEEEKQDELAAPNLETEPSSESVFTESLAKIYIKQKQYEKALHIFERLNLKFPEKSAYFADQISFLKKIIKTNS